MTAGRLRQGPTWAAIVGACLPVFAVCAGASPSAFAETRGYAISMIHTATYGDKDTCPQGGNGGNRDVKIRRLIAQGKTEEEAIKIADNVQDEVANNPVVGQGVQGGGARQRPNGRGASP